MIKIREIDHLVIRVKDLNRMLDFYCGILGCKIERQQESIGLTQLRAGRSLIDLHCVNEKTDQKDEDKFPVDCRNMDHFCLRVEPFDGDAIVDYLASKDVPAGEIHSRYGAEGEGPSVYINDPEGNTVELKGAPWRQ